MTSEKRLLNVSSEQPLSEYPDKETVEFVYQRVHQRYLQKIDLCKSLQSQSVMTLAILVFISSVFASTCISNKDSLINYFNNTDSISSFSSTTSHQSVSHSGILNTDLDRVIVDLFQNFGVDFSSNIITNTTELYVLQYITLIFIIMAIVLFSNYRIMTEIGNESGQIDDLLFSNQTNPIPNKSELLLKCITILRQADEKIDIHIHFQKTCNMFTIIIAFVAFLLLFKGIMLNYFVSMVIGIVICLITCFLIFIAIYIIKLVLKNRV